MTETKTYDSVAAHGNNTSSTPFSGLLCLTDNKILQKKSWHTSREGMLYGQASWGFTTHPVNLWCNKVSLQLQKDPSLRAGRGNS